MLSARPLAVGAPLTQRDVIVAAQRLATTGDSSGRVCVQARRNHRDGPYWLCGEVLELGAGDAEWFKVQTAIDTWWAHGRDLRLCAPDGSCDFDDSIASPRHADKSAQSTGSATAVPAQQPGRFRCGCAVQPTGHPT